MSKDKRRYLSAYVPEVKPKETPKRGETKDSGRLREIEDAIQAFNDLLSKQNRDNLDALYNIDMDNMSSSMRRLFASFDNGITKSQAEIKVWADEMEAGFSAIAQWQGQVENGTISSIAAINAKADANGASITQLAAWQKTADEEIDGLVSTTAVIKAEADANGASIEQIVSAVGSDGKVTAASIALAVSEEESFIQLIADKVSVEGVVTFESLEADGGSVINGNNISLISDAYGDSISRLTFYKWRYTDDTEEDHTLDSMFRIQTQDNETDDENLARYAAVIQTFSAYEDSTKYSVALKLISYGAMSFESGGSLYALVDTYCTLDAGYNVRINAPLSYADACMWGYAAANNSYVFCKEGIYYVDSDGGATVVATV